MNISHFGLVTSAVNTEDPTYQLYSPYFVSHEMTEGELAETVALPNEYMTETIRAYWQEDTTCTLSKYMYDENLSTPDKARIAFKVKPR